MLGAQLHVTINSHLCQFIQISIPWNFVIFVLFEVTFLAWNHILRELAQMFLSGIYYILGSNKIFHDIYFLSCPIFDIMCGECGRCGKNITPNIAENGQKDRKKAADVAKFGGSLYKMMKVVQGHCSDIVICLLLGGEYLVEFSFPRLRFGSTLKSISYQID